MATKQQTRYIRCTNCGRSSDCNKLFVSTNCFSGQETDHYYCHTCAAKMINESLSLLNEVPKCIVPHCNKPFKNISLPKSINRKLFGRYRMDQNHFHKYKRERHLLRGYIRQNITEKLRFPTEIKALIHDFYKLVLFTEVPCDKCHCSGFETCVNIDRRDTYFAQKCTFCINGIRKISQPCTECTNFNPLHGIDGIEFIDIKKMINCENCQGCGIVYSNCRLCDGKGQNMIHKCHQCKGSCKKRCAECDSNGFLFFTDFNKVVSKQNYCHNCNTFEPNNEIFYWSECKHTFCTQCIFRSKYIENELKRHRIPVCLKPNCQTELNKKDLKLFYNFAIDTKLIAFNYQLQNLIPLFEAVEFKRNNFLCFLCTDRYDVFHHNQDMLVLTCGCKCSLRCGKLFIAEKYENGKVPHCYCGKKIAVSDIEIFCGKHYMLQLESRFKKFIQSRMEYNGFQRNYIVRAFRAYEEHYGHLCSDEIKVIRDIIIRLQCRDKLYNMMPTHLRDQYFESVSVINAEFLCMNCAKNVLFEELFISPNCFAVNETNHYYCQPCAAKIINESLSLLNEAPKCIIPHCNKPFNIALANKSMNSLLLTQYKMNLKNFAKYKKEKHLLPGYIRQNTEILTRYFPKEIMALIHDFYKVILYSERTCDNCDCSEFEICLMCDGKGNTYVPERKCKFCMNGLRKIHKLCRSNNIFYTDFNKVVSKQNYCHNCNTFRPNNEIIYWSECKHTFCTKCVLDSKYIEKELKSDRIPVCLTQNCKKELNKNDLKLFYNFAIETHLIRYKKKQKIRLFSLFDTLFKKNNEFQCCLCGNNVFHKKKERLSLAICGCKCVLNCAKLLITSKVDNGVIPHCYCGKKIAMSDIKMLCGNKYVFMAETFEYNERFVALIRRQSTNIEAKDSSKVLKLQHEWLSYNDHKLAYKIIDFLSLTSITIEDIKYLNIIPTKGNIALFQLFLNDAKTAKRIRCEIWTLQQKNPLYAKWSVGFWDVYKDEGQYATNNNQSDFRNNSVYYQNTMNHGYVRNYSRNNGYVNGNKRYYQNGYQPMMLNRW